MIKMGDNSTDVLKRQKMFGFLCLLPLLFWCPQHFGGKHCTFLLKYVYFETLVTSEGMQPSTFTQVVHKYFHFLLCTSTSASMPLSPPHQAEMNRARCFATVPRLSVRYPHLTRCLISSHLIFHQSFMCIYTVQSIFSGFFSPSLLSIMKQVPNGEMLFTH